MDKISLKTNVNILPEESVLNWEIIQKDFEKSFGTEVYSSWLKNILLVKEYNHYVILGVPTRFFRDWITSRYADKILSELKKHKLSINRIEFKILGKNFEVERFDVGFVKLDSPKFVHLDGDVLKKYTK